MHANVGGWARGSFDGLRSGPGGLRTFFRTDILLMPASAARPFANGLNQLDPVDFGA